jgi:hypothetical protein
MSMFVIILYALASAAALWAIAGLCNPQALCFALPEYRTRKNAFLFPLRLAVPSALVAYMESYLAANISHSWGASLGVYLAFLWYAAKRVAVLRGHIEL